MLFRVGYRFRHSLLPRVIFALICFVFLLKNGQCSNDHDWNTQIASRRRTSCAYTITVDRSGHGNFTRIQQAVNAVRVWNKDWACIFIKRGIYREKVTIPPEKTNIMFRGEGKKVTHIEWDGQRTVAESPTLTVLADNFVAKYLTFTNTYNTPWSTSENPRVPAVAVMVVADKVAFYRCSFVGLQDTLWDDIGRHYYKQCTIVGAVDFIFGIGQSIYDRCVISVLGDTLDPGSAGYITAQGRNNPNDSNGFVFKCCSIIGTGLSYLGRPWRGYARVLFYNTTMSDIIEPTGWNVWTSRGREKQLTLAEYGCSGPGSNTSLRVPWEKKLKWAEVQKLIDIKFIDTEGWLYNQP